MKRTKGFIAVILTIVALAFIVFVGIMQQKFTNPNIASMPDPQAVTESGATDIKNESDKDDAEEMDTQALAIDSVGNDEEAEDVEVTVSTRTVEVDTLNVRSGPGVDYDLVGVLLMDQQVEVEDTGEEWVKVTTDEFIGYVNANFLSKE